MHSELFRIPIRWAGVPIFGFGLLLAAWLAATAWGMMRTAKQHGWPAALRAHLPTALIVAAIIVWGVPTLFPDGMPIRGYGVMVLAGSVLAILLAIRRAEQANLPTEEILAMAVPLFGCGVIGARLFYVVQFWQTRIRQPTLAASLVEALKFTEGGLVVYGALIGAAIGCVWHFRRRRLPLLAMSDLVAPSLLVGVALGRIGCFLNGCCYGGESTRPWAVTFPQFSAPNSISPPYADQAASGRFYGFRWGNQSIDDAKQDASVAIDRVDASSPAEQARLKIGDAIAAINGELTPTRQHAEAALLDALIAGRPVELRLADGSLRTIAAIDPPPRSRPVAPAQLFSALDAALLAWLLWSYYPFRRHEGETTALLLTLHPISRFLLEIVRVDEAAVFGTGLSISQNISIALFVVGIALWCWLLRKPPKLDFPLPPT